MPFSCKIGDSFFLNDGGGGHRYIILTNPNSEDKQVIVNFTDVKNVRLLPIFTPKDDPNLFTKHTSIHYRYAKLVFHERLLSLQLTQWAFCNLKIVRKIVIGAFQSSHTPNYIIRELRKQYPVEYNKYHTWDIDELV